MISDVKIAKPWSASRHRHPVLLLYTQSSLYNYTPQPGQRQPRVIWAKLFNLDPRPEPEPFHILQLSQNTPSTSSRALHYNCDNSVLLSWCFHTTSRCLLQGRCNREKPACKYFHPPQHLKVQEQSYCSLCSAVVIIMYCGWYRSVPLSTVHWGCVCRTSCWSTGGTTSRWRTPSPSRCSSRSSPARCPPWWVHTLTILYCAAFSSFFFSYYVVTSWKNNTLKALNEKREITDWSNEFKWLSK